MGIYFQYSMIQISIQNHKRYLKRFVIVSTIQFYDRRLKIPYARN